MKRRVIRVLCVDDHDFLIDGLQSRFEAESDIELVGRLNTAEKLVEEALRTKADVVLLDIEMPGPDAFEAADQLRRSSPQTKTVFLSAYVRDRYVSAAFKSGAWGYFSKSDESEAIVEGIRKVYAGEFALGPKVAERCAPPSPSRGASTIGVPATKLDTLTSREQEVLRMIGRGLNRVDIAQALHRSPKTIDGHRENLMHKLDIHDRGELVRFAIREGLVEA